MRGIFLVMISCTLSKVVATQIAEPLDFDTNFSPLEKNKKGAPGWLSRLSVRLRPRS